jgi:hypothetical protein
MNYGAITVQEPAKTMSVKEPFYQKLGVDVNLPLSSATKIDTQKRGSSSDLVVLWSRMSGGRKE